MKNCGLEIFKIHQLILMQVEKTKKQWPQVLVVLKKLINAEDSKLFGLSYRLGNNVFSKPGLKTRAC